MLSSSSAYRVALTQHETNWTSKATSHDLDLLVFCRQSSTKWPECLLWELEVKETGEPRPLEVYPVAPSPGILGIWPAQAGLLHSIHPQPFLSFPINPRSYSHQEA